MLILNDSDFVLQHVVLLVDQMWLAQFFSHCSNTKYTRVNFFFLLLSIQYVFFFVNTQKMDWVGMWAFFELVQCLRLFCFHHSLTTFLNGDSISIFVFYSFEIFLSSHCLNGKIFIVAPGLFSMVEKTFKMMHFCHIWFMLFLWMCYSHRDLTLFLIVLWFWLAHNIDGWTVLK